MHFHNASVVCIFAAELENPFESSVFSFVVVVVGSFSFNHHQIDDRFGKRNGETGKGERQEKLKGNREKKKRKKSLAHVENPKFAPASTTFLATVISYIRV